MQYLKQSTAFTAKIGPFLDDTDGKTAETGLTIAQADVRLSKGSAGNFAQKNEATSCTHDELGYYDCPLDATDTGTVGQLRLAVHESGALPVWQDFFVAPANVFDSLVGTDNLNVEVAAMAADVITAAAHDESTSYPLAAASSTLATEAELDKVPKSDGAVTWNATALASVQTVVDAAIDTIIPELGVAAPADTPTLRTGLMHLVMRAINESIMNNSTGYVSVANAAGTVISKQLVTDAAGVTTIDKSISG